MTVDAADRPNRPAELLDFHQRLNVASQPPSGLRVIDLLVKLLYAQVEAAHHDGAQLIGQGCTRRAMWASIRF
jgi:hypothetical protein